MDEEGRKPDNPNNRGAIPKVKPEVNITTNNNFEDDHQATSVGTMINCFSNVLTIFGKPDYKSLNGGDSWEVPYESLKNELYLCSGAQGIVYSARLNGEIVAVKKVRSKSETNIKHLAKLNHENIARFRGVCVEAPNYCLIIEFCQYGSLYDFLGSASLHPKQLIKWAKDIAAGMQYLHSHKIIHRDLKSPNVLIADDLVLKVSDFGTARTWDNVSTIMTFSGTVPWMAPEIIRQEPCTERVDVWSYGVVLWEMLTKEVPYKNMETPTILWGIGTKALSLPVPATCPNSMQMILCQCWNYVARNRPSFKIILAHLEMAAADIVCMDTATFNEKQAIWGEEVRDVMSRMSDSRERQLNACRCGARPKTKANGKGKANETRRRRKNDAELVVNFIEKGEGGKTVTVAVQNQKYNIEGALNNNNKVEPKNTVVEKNGNVDIVKKEVRKKDSKVPDVAHV